MKAQGFSTKFEDHKGLLHMLARRYFARAKSAGVLTDYEDVFSEMCVGYAKAVRGYDPSRGITFTAYCGVVCWHHVNKVMEKEEAAGPKLGLVRLEDLQPDQNSSQDDCDDSILDHGDFDQLGDLDDDNSDDEPAESPEEICERKQEFIHKIRQLSPVTRRYVAHLIGYRVDNSFNPNPEARRLIRREVEEVYGVPVSKIRL